MTEHKIFIIVSGKENTSAIFKKVGASVDGLGKATEGMGKASDGLGKSFDGLGKNAKSLGGALKKPIAEWPGFDKPKKDTKGLGKAFDGLKKQTSGLRGDLAKLIGGAAIAGAAKASISASLAAGRYRTSLEGLAGGAKEASGFISGIQDASLGTISQIDAMAISSKALSLKVVDNAQNMKDLTEVAITLGRAQGLSATQAVDDLTTAIGRQSPLILDNLGITLKTSEAQQIYANSMGKTVAQLTDVEKSQAFANAALIKGQEVAAKLGGVQEDAAAKSERFKAQVSNLSIAVGDGLVPALSAGLDVITPLVSGLADMEAGTVTFAAGLGIATVAVFKLGGGLDVLKTKSIAAQASVGILAAALVGLVVATEFYNKKTAETAVAADDAQQAAGTLGDQVDELVDSGLSLNDALAEMAPGVDKAAGAWDDLNPAVKLFGKVSGNSEKFTKTMTAAQDSLNQSIVGNVDGFFDYVTAVDNFNANVTEGGARITAFTETQFNMTRIMQEGASAASLQADAIFQQRLEMDAQTDSLEAAQPAWITANRVQQGFSDLQVVASNRMREREGVLGSLNQATEASSEVMALAAARQDHAAGSAERQASITARLAEQQSAAAESTAEFADSQQNLIGQLQGANEEAFKAQVLGEFDAADIGLDAYTALGQELGILSQEQVDLATSIPILTQAYTDGVIPTENMAEATAALFDAAGTLGFETTTILDQYAAMPGLIGPSADAVEQQAEKMVLLGEETPTAGSALVDFGGVAAAQVGNVDVLTTSVANLNTELGNVSTTSIPTSGTGETPSFGGGGIVPGNPRQAVPIVAHGTERVVPVGQSVGPTGPPTSNNTTNFNRAGDTVILQGEAAVSRYMALRQREDKLARHSARM